MTKPLDRTVNDDGGGTARVALVGDINESATLSPLVELPQSNLVIDLAGVSRINSCGVREWIAFVVKLHSHALSGVE